VGAGDTSERVGSRVGGSSVGLHTSMYLQSPLSNPAALQHLCRLLKDSEVLAS